MTEELSQLPIWLFVQIYDFQTHSIKVKFSESSDVIVTLRLNPIIESQLLKLIDSGVIPKRIQVFLQDNEISSLIGHEELREELSIKEILKGNYPKKVSREFMEKQRDQLRLEISQSSDYTWFLDSELKKIADDIYFGITSEKGKDLKIFLKNHTKAFLTNFSLTFNTLEIHMKSFPKYILPNGTGEFTIVYIPKNMTKPLHATMKFSCSEIYADPENYERVLKEIENESSKVQH